MALNADNVRVAVTGGIFVAPTSTTLPTTADGELDAGFDDLGYVGEDGITEAQASDVTDIVAWQNAAVVRKVQTSHDLSYAFTLIETKDEVLENYYGAITGGVVEVTGDQLARKAWVIDVIDGDHEIRIVVPDGQVTERGDITYASGEAIGYPVTLTAFPDEDGVKAYIYRTDDGS